MQVINEGSTPSDSTNLWRGIVIGNDAVLKTDVSASIRRAGSSPALAATIWMLGSGTPPHLGCGEFREFESHHPDHKQY